MAQRIARAKARLRASGARFEIPAAAQLPDRVASASHVLYLIFTEGHTATSGAGLSDPILADEAIHLTRQLHQRIPAADEVTGLLALMLLTQARHRARVSSAGDLVPLADQDRSLWDQALIDEGVRLVEQTLPRGPVGPYQLQAAIAAVHAEAATAADTDWVQIELLYRMLDGVAPGPVVALNHAAAVAMADSPRAALAMLDPLLRDPRMRHHHRVHAVHGHLLELDGRVDAARAAYRKAARLATSIPEQRYLNAKAAASESPQRNRSGHVTS
jgi:predicted RNA polymerase sigma factor